jgi:hypothetical protein
MKPINLHSTALRRARHRSVIAVALVAAAVGVSACASTKTSVAQLWSAPLPSSPAPMGKVIVMATRMDQANRRSLEDSFAAALAARGVEAIPSYKLLPGALPERAEAEKTIRSVGADGILSLNFKGISERPTYVPGEGYSGGFWGGYYAWGVGYGGYYEGYVHTDDIVNIEATLWDERVGDTVVWTALTNTNNPATGNALVRSVTDRVVPELSKAGFIPSLPSERPAERGHP